MSKQLLQWHTVRRRVDSLVPHEKNPRTISEKQIEDLKKSLRKFNLVELPALNLDGTILAGHQRVKILKLLGRGREKIEVRVPNRQLTSKEAEQYLLSSNALGGTWDYEKLKAFEIDTLLIIGFSENDLAQIWDQNLESEDDDFNVTEEIKKIKKPKTKQGDLFALGAHRLIAGDATNPAVLKKLFGKERASMVYSDPPFNLNIDYARGLGGRQDYGGNVLDKRTDEDYKVFLRKSMNNALAVVRDDTHFFYWCDQSYIWLIQQLYNEIGITNKRVCLWIKNGAYPTPGIAFSKCYESCVYGIKGKPFLSEGVKNLSELLNKELGTGNRLIDDILDQLDIWLVKRLSGDQYLHATSKPPALHEKAIRRCTRPGDIILDSFLGSGSTLIAGEQLKRRVYGCELELIYCDLIIKRYEKLTGKKAKKLN